MQVASVIACCNYLARVSNTSQKMRASIGPILVGIVSRFNRSKSASRVFTICKLNPKSTWILQSVIVKRQKICALEFITLSSVNTSAPGYDCLTKTSHGHDHWWVKWAVHNIKYRDSAPFFCEEAHRQIVVQLISRILISQQDHRSRFAKVLDAYAWRAVGYVIRRYCSLRLVFMRNFAGLPQ